MRKEIHILGDVITTPGGALLKYGSHLSPANTNNLIVHIDWLCRAALRPYGRVHQGSIPSYPLIYLHVSGAARATLQVYVTRCELPADTYPDSGHSTQLGSRRQAGDSERRAPKPPRMFHD